MNNYHDTNDPKPRSRQPRVSYFTAIFTALGGVSGLLSICLVIFKGGALERQVNINTSDISTLVALGSPGYRAHERADDERVGDLRRRASDSESRLLAMETSLKQYGELKVEIRVVGTKLDAIAERLKSIETTAAEQLKQSTK